jgi:hypothetical protein
VPEHGLAENLGQRLARKTRGAVSRWDDPAEFREFTHFRTAPRLYSRVIEEFGNKAAGEGRTALTIFHIPEGRQGRSLFEPGRPLKDLSPMKINTIVLYA